ncbi:hypothetical protein DLAC_06012 [Tieghemostelium lacteum]|uniref:Pesticidal crystal protein domain-containing protein n=1 Tax=Tieghemostelium lacteum TaxID=361077 RepID=A0A151ZH88_TIELA|nr:hypothetical protein DLAC_06012 [Tieghemostelium lacteum]|eukprot:KYQ93342.1 hypothetical protein DLAC_06012 [Tieghemostelium lacteum]
MSKVFLNKLEFRDYQLSVVNTAMANQKIILGSQAVQLSYNTLKTFVSGLLYLIPDGGFIAGIATTIWSVIDDINASGNNATNNETIPGWAKTFFDVQNTNYQLDVLKAKLKDIKDFKTNFATYLDTYKQNPGATAAKNAVRNSFEDLDRYFITCYNSCLVGDDVNKGKLLPMYVLYVTMRLVHLRDGYLNGSNFSYGDPMKATFLKNFQDLLTEAYTLVSTTYTNAVQKIKEANSNQGVLLWNAINRYRSQMIINAFDYVNIWYTLHPKNFPLKTASESVRYVYSDIAGFPVKGNGLVSGSNSYIDSQYYNTPIATINTMIEANGEYKKDLKSVQFSTLKSRCSAVGTTHVERGVDVKRQGPGVVDANAQWKTVNSLVNSVSFKYDVFPRNVNVDSFEVNWNPSTGAAENHYTSGWYDVFILPNNFNKTNLDMAMNDFQSLTDPRCARSVVSGSNTFIGHKLGHAFSVGVNKDPLLASDFTSTVDALCFGFLPIDVFQDNITYGKLYNIFDPLKYISKTGTLYYKQDYVRIGSNALEFGPGCTATYSFDPEKGPTDPDNRFVIGIKISTDGAGQLRIYNADNQLKFDLKTTGPAYNTILWGDNANTCVFNRGVGKNTFKFEVPNTSPTVFLEAIILKPYIPPVSA